MSGLGYETRDVKIRPLVWLAVGIFGGAVVVHLSLWIMLAYFNKEARQSDQPQSPLAARDQSPPAPRLQETPVHDYQQLRSEQEHVLHSYGWVDRERGIVRIPIEQAMQILVERDQETGDNR